MLHFGGAGAVRHRALEARRDRRVRRRPAARLDRRLARRELPRLGAGRAARRPCSCRPSRTSGIADAHVEALLSWARDGYTAAAERRDDDVEGFLPIFFLVVVLKIPVAALLYLVWWAIRAEHRCPRRRRPSPRTTASAACAASRSARAARAAAPTRPTRGRSRTARRAGAPACSRRRRRPRLIPRAPALAPEIDLKALPGVAAPEGPGRALQPPAARQITLELL